MNNNNVNISQIIDLKNTYRKILLFKTCLINNKQYDYISSELEPERPYQSYIILSVEIVINVRNFVLSCRNCKNFAKTCF